jgi:hypothetical protein
MKQLLILFSFVAAIVLVACNDDAKTMILANPTAPVLNAPSHATTAYVKDSTAYVLNLDSTGLAETFTATAANYGVDVNVTYTLQIDKTGSNFAHVQNVTNVTSSTNPSIAVPVTTLYNVITNATLNAPTGRQTSFDLRLMATIGVSQQTVYSNVITIKIDPILSLKPYTSVTPKPYYIVGLADGTWNNSTSGLGVSLIPLGLVPGKAYLSSGAGTFIYTGYIKASQSFKLIRDVGGWDEQWGNNGSDGINSPKRKNGGPDPNNFKVPADGYYTITLNSIANTCTIVAATVTPTSYTSIDMPGAQNGWTISDYMTAVQPVNNHDWYKIITFSGTGEVKFRANADPAWTVNWGSPSATNGDPLYFPNGIGKQGGGNIGFQAGTYVVMFNDISGNYYFVKK